MSILLHPIRNVTGIVVRFQVLRGCEGYPMKYEHKKKARHCCRAFDVEPEGSCHIVVAFAMSKPTFIFEASLPVVSLPVKLYSNFTKFRLRLSVGVSPPVDTE